MAISAAAVWEVRTTGAAANVNGGFFVTGATGTDYSQQDAAQYYVNAVGITPGAGAVITDAAAAAVMVGNGLCVTGGANMTNGDYEIVSVVVGVSITVDRNCCTGVSANATYRIGGAKGVIIDALFEAAGTGGNKIYIKGGTYTVSGTVSIAANGGTQKPVVIEGYQTVRGDVPTGSGRPLFDCAANIFTFGTNWDTYCMQFTGTGTQVVACSAAGKMVKCKVTNTSTTAARIAYNLVTCRLISCEAISYRGIAVSGSSNHELYGCYVHDSDIGISNASVANPAVYVNNLIINNVTNAIKFTGARTALTIAYGNTFFGSETKLGTAISFITGATAGQVLNNIFYGFVTAITHADVQTVTYDDFNDFYNNTSDVNNWTKGVSDQAINPGFAALSHKSGTTATTSGSTLTDSSASFATSVVAGRDYVYISAGTGVTVGKYGIVTVNPTSLVLDIAPGTDATADKVYQITCGRDFQVSTSLSDLGYPTIFPGGFTTNYSSIGAVGRPEAASLSVAAISAGVWDYLTASAVTANSMGKLVTDNVNASISAVKAKTDNLPSDPADASDIATATTAIAGYIDTEVGLIKAKTDLIPAAPAAVGDIPTAIQIASRVFDTETVETGFTFRQALRLMSAALAGKVSGAATATVVIRDLADAKDRITATVDASGNRTAVTKDVT